MVEKSAHRDNRSLERIAKGRPFENSGEIHKEWTEAGVDRDVGYNCRVPRVQPLLNLSRRQKRITWAKEKENGANVLFSDESKDVACHLEIEVPESGGKVVQHRVHVA